MENIKKGLKKQYFSPIITYMVFNGESVLTTSWDSGDYSGDLPIR